MQPPRLSQVLRPTSTVMVHGGEQTLAIGVALRCGEPKAKQPPRLAQVYRPVTSRVETREVTCRDQRVKVKRKDYTVWTVENKELKPYDKGNHLIYTRRGPDRNPNADPRTLC